MAELTEIEWCDHTFNPWEGCQHAGPGCDHCYAEARNLRFNGGEAINWGPGAPRRRTSPANWSNPKRWQAQAEAFAAQNGGRKQRVFCASLADVFDNAVDEAWRADLGAMIMETPDLEWLLLTKRIGNAPKMLLDMFPGSIPKNVRIGATIVNQHEAIRDLVKVIMVASMTHLKPFLSMEPLLGPVDLSDAYDGWHHAIGQVIVGGESGAGARPMHPAWARSLRDQCADAGVAFFFKQWGEWVALESSEDWDFWEFDHRKHQNHVIHYSDLDTTYFKVGKAGAGRLLDGVTHDGYPND